MSPSSHNMHCKETNNNITINTNILFQYMEKDFGSTFKLYHVYR